VLPFPCSDLKRSTEIQNGEEPFFANVEPSSRVKLSLRPYQLEGLRWLTARESESQRSFKLQLPPGWTEFQTEAGKRYYMNDETKQTYWTFPYEAWASNFDRQRVHMPVRVCGGILADDMGMGKTIQILSLIMANTPLSADSMEEPKRFCPTLIVCPLSVLNQWYSEMTSHVEKGVLSIYTYHGPNRKKDVAFLSSHDVVLTTYATLAGEFQNSGTNSAKNSLAQVKWFRVVLDEAHTIKDRGTLTAKAACNLEAQRRWAVTGTPIQNKLAEIYSLFVFLRVEPLADQEFWTNAIMKPIRNRDERGLDRLRSALSSILLRRTKDQKVEGSTTEAIVNLPPRQVDIERVQFSESEQLFYDALWSNSKIAFEQMLAHGTVMQNYAHVLELLLRVRQACDHPQLVVDHQRRRQEHESLEGTEPTTVKGRLRSSKKKSDSGELAVSSSASGAPESTAPKEEMCECNVCYEDVAAATAFGTSCDHTICLQCVQDYMLVREDDLTQFEESLSGSGSGLSGTGHCPVCKSSLDYADDIAPLSISSAAAAAAKGAAAGGAASPVLKHDHDYVPIKKEQHDDDSYDTDDDMKVDSKMDLRRSMAISAPGAEPEEEPEATVVPKEDNELISLRTSNTIGNLRNSNYNPTWTFLAPAQNYPIVSEKVEDPVATFMEGKPISAVPDVKQNGEPKTVTIDSIPKRSIKIQALVNDILRLKTDAPDEKAVVFSQWTTMLDLIQQALGEEGIAYGRLDGKMSQRSREEAIAQFKANPNVRVFLISMKAGGLGLNLVVANHVYLMDPWWNPSTEEQAIDRCHRIGQSRPVSVKRFIIQNSIEERILELQEKKRSLARGALGRKAATLKEMRLEDLRLLFNH
jgi:SNF2 family DNA or RNA helicase